MEGSEWDACLCPSNPVPALRLLAAPGAGLPSSFQLGLAPGCDRQEIKGRGVRGSVFIPCHLAVGWP